MRVQITSHTLQRARERGANESEIREVLESGSPTPVKYGTPGKAKVFDYNGYRSGRWYSQKRVEVYFAIEGDVISTITVYVFYGKWESPHENRI
ncbi:MAG: DUF4258 domain-containing protein [Spirochaetia bacterium]